MRPQECVTPIGRTGIVKPRAAQNQPGENKLHREAGQQVGFELPSDPYVLATEVAQKRALKRVEPAVERQEAGQRGRSVHRAWLGALASQDLNTGQEAVREERDDGYVSEGR